MWGQAVVCVNSEFNLVRLWFEGAVWLEIVF